jgi:polygalacturonase
LTLTGPPTAVVDGLGWPWWANFTNGTLAHQRPKLLEIVDCADLTVAGLTFRNSPFWTLHPTYCDRVRFLGVTALAPRAVGNTDGIDPDSCTNVVIDGCHVDVGDDGISLKSGPHDVTGELLPTANVTITRTTVLSRNVAIGSACFGGIYNVTMTDSVIGDDQGSCPWAVKAKTHVPNGGVVSGVTFTNLTLGAIAPNTWQQRNGGWVVIAYENYGYGASDTQPAGEDDDDVDARVAAWVRHRAAAGLGPTPPPTRMDDIAFEGVNATSAYVVASLNGYSASTAFSGWRFGDIAVRTVVTPKAQQWQCVDMTHTTVTGALSPGMEDPAACGVGQ